VTSSFLLPSYHPTPNHPRSFFVLTTSLPFYLFSHLPFFYPSFLLRQIFGPLTIPHDHQSFFLAEKWKRYLGHVFVLISFTFFKTTKKKTDKCSQLSQFPNKQKKGKSVPKAGEEKKAHLS